ncbi:Acetylornithine/acetyl-lysine aminotransferase [Roseimaritima multifibrata]|uniref:Acetylornithine/acetyl-lysine aminotransferase n=1 Tax=Roseimaritima multifibrata TaxID=1930274 RepID=A0A517MP95_9BACT|nr:aminotransferase class III-fold pyridoxal phosphate-dependent enzyme [Roseimaritima multifibrata]QDS96597.1 Acetylornithine/acetyl-lysine aminotransferase [Roseimaritima multifibrata]
MTVTASDSLQAEKLRADPRVLEAKRLLQEALAEHGAPLTEVRPPRESLLAGYEAMLKRLETSRGGKPIWPYLASGIGNGPWVELADGSVKLDMIGGIGVHGAGHSHPAILDAAVDAAIEDTLMQGNLQQHPPGMVLSERLLEWAVQPNSQQESAALDHCMLSTSGAMANENALKIALHHAAPADRVIAFENAFAGRSLAMAAITDRPNYRQGLPLALQVDYLPFLDPADPVGSQQRAVDELKRLLNRHPGRYGAFWAEPFAGEGGYYSGSHDFLMALCRPLKEAGVPIIFDEVQAFSRLSRPYAFQHYGLESMVDIVTVGKITQVCATLYGEAFKPKGPILSQTFTGASASIAAGLTMLDQLQQANCFGEDGANMQRHRYFAAALEGLAKKYPGKISGPFGEGMMIAFTPGDGQFETAKALLDTLYTEGLLGFICGAQPTRIRFLPPPAIATNEHIDQACQILDRVLAKGEAE